MKLEKEKSEAVSEPVEVVKDTDKLKD